MTLAVRAVSEIASEMGLVPLAWLAWRHMRGHRPGVAWWWIAGALGVSWLADTAALWVYPWLISAVYPVSQAALVGAVFLDRRDALRLLVVLGVVASADVLWHGVDGPTVFLRLVAWGAVAGIVWDRPALGRLRVALLAYFGLGLLAWLAYAGWPGWWGYSVYQSTRLAGLTLFCWASLSPGPQLTLARGATR